MKTLEEFAFQYVHEGRRPGSKNKPKELKTEDMANDKVTVDGEKVVDLPKDKIDLKDYIGKDAEKNGSEGLWGVEEPTAEDAIPPFKTEEMNANETSLAFCFDAEVPFFIQGRAGWAKTSLIKRVAKHFGYTIITVYLDKAEATDLSGIPVAQRDKDGKLVQDTAWPAWAKIIKDYPNKKFLLFFDEMNQAAPDVQNALMPIVNPDQHQICGHKLDNYLVAAAGNLEDENIGVTDLQGPLMSRFYYISWESNTPETWKSAFKYLHQKWDDQVSKECVDDLERICMNFKNPREIEQFIFKPLTKAKNGRFKDAYNAKFFYKSLLRLARPDEEGNINRTVDNEFKKLGEKCANYLKTGFWGDAEKAKKKNRQMVQLSNEEMETLISAVKTGSMNNTDGSTGEIIEYGMSKETLKKVLTDENIMTDQVMNGEIADRFIQKLETDGVKFKYEKDSDMPDDLTRIYKFAKANKLTLKDILDNVIKGKKTAPRKRTEN